MARLVALYSAEQGKSANLKIVRRNRGGPTTVDAEDAGEPAEKPELDVRFLPDDDDPPGPIRSDPV